MGFVQAIAEVGGLDIKPGLESYLKLPLAKGGKIIRIYMDLADLNADILQVKGIAKIDVADQISSPDMKMKYLYRDKVGSNVYWGFTPLHKIGKPKARREANANDWSGTDEDWRTNNKSHLNKIQNRVLKDYEKEGVLEEGAAELLMKQLEQQLDVILDAFQNRESHVVLFGGERNEDFVYPGEIPAFVQYFERKLEQSLQGKGIQETKSCSLCGKDSEDMATLSSIFKFSTMDKVNFLPGLDKKRQDSVFAICRSCLEKVSAGRERVERTLTSTTVVPGLRLWVIPEAVGPEGNKSVRTAVFRLEQLWGQSELETPGERAEERLFQQMAKEGSDLVFHFIFWEKNNAMELIHLMVEDVPPERLAFLARKWKEAFQSVVGDVDRGVNLDWAIKSLYVTLSRFAGKSEGDKLVFRDFALKVLGKMLRGEKLPILTFKQIVVSRSARLIFETENWNEIKRNLLYAQIWIEYMNLINRG
jgi:CRISPR-associated protein Csh1